MVVTIPVAGARSLLALDALCCVAGCTGAVGDRDPSGGFDSTPGAVDGDPDHVSDDSGLSSPPVTNSSASFACNPEVEPDSSPLPRLSRAQYLGMLEVVLSNTLGGEARELLEHPAVKAELLVVPEDARIPDPGPDIRSGFRRFSQDVNELFVKSTYAVATAIGRTLGTSAQLRSLLGPCADTAKTEPADSARCALPDRKRGGRIAPTT